MSKVITFSRKFPAYHPLAGKQTYFVEKILQSFEVHFKAYAYADWIYAANKDKFTFEEIESFWVSLQDIGNNPKIHTIRAGNRFKSGELFSPRIWFGKPYNSPQLIFWEDAKIKQVYEIDVDENQIIAINGQYIDGRNYDTLAVNDGFKSSLDLRDWLVNYEKPKAFKGSVICWQDVEY